VLRSPFVERTSIGKRDELEWLPEQAQASKRTVNKWSWGLGTVAMFVGSYLCVMSHLQGAAAIGAWLVFLIVTGPGANLITNRIAGRRAMERLRRLATDTEHLHQLGGIGDGELVRARGRVKLRAAEELAPPMPPGAVFVRRRTKTEVQERAIDFSLVDETLGEVWVDVGSARLLHPSGEQERLGDLTLRVGDQVEVLGWKSRTIDPSLGDRLDRQDPVRVVLRAGRSLPLLIVPIGPAVLTASTERPALPSRSTL
jgi:hypothetical protein